MAATGPTPARASRSAPENRSCSATSSNSMTCSACGATSRGGLEVSVQYSGHARYELQRKPCASYAKGVWLFKSDGGGITMNNLTGFLRNQIGAFRYLGLLLLAFSGTAYSQTTFASITGT